MGICILTYRLFLLPTNESLDALRAVFSGSPIEIDWSTLAVEIASSKSPIVTAEPDMQYRALTSNMDVWYESATGSSSLLLSLLPSPEMVERHNAVGDAWGRPLFYPFVKVAHDPLLRRNRRAFLNSVSTRLVDYPIVLTFCNETVLKDASVVPSQQDFYDDYVTRGSEGRLSQFEDFNL